MLKFSITLSFCLLVAFPISFCLLLEFIKKGSKTFIILLLILFLFILGFHSYGQDTQNSILYKNSTLITCEINYPIIDNIFGLDLDKECDGSKLSKYNYKADFGNNYKYVFVNTPFFKLRHYFRFTFKIKNLQILYKKRR